MCTIYIRKAAGGWVRVYRDSDADVVLPGGKGLAAAVDA